MKELVRSERDQIRNWFGFASAHKFAYLGSVSLLVRWLGCVAWRGVAVVCGGAFNFLFYFGCLGLTD